jgi:hypothetical protein
VQRRNTKATHRAPRLLFNMDMIFKYIDFKAAEYAEHPYEEA